MYDDRTNGSFTWKCDLPAGLSVAAMFYVVQDGASGTQGAQASTPDAVINAGSAGTSCLGTNDPGSQSKIYSLASSLDPAFSATRCEASTLLSSLARNRLLTLLPCAAPALSLPQQLDPRQEAEEEVAVAVREVSTPEGSGPLRGESR